MLAVAGRRTNNLLHRQAEAARERANLAPFSYFGGVTSSPPIVMVSVGRRRGEAPRKPGVRRAKSGRTAPKPKRPIPPKGTLPGPGKLPPKG